MMNLSIPSFAVREVFFVNPLLFVRELFDSFLRSLRFFVFICVVVSLDFPLLTLSWRVVLPHDSVNRRVLFSIFIAYSCFEC